MTLGNIGAGFLVYWNASALDTSVVVGDSIKQCDHHVLEVHEPEKCACRNMDRQALLHPRKTGSLLLSSILNFG